ncbi:MAG TPA: MarR family transcriptional regulator [Rhodoblastus sp.]|nr:MarR family transcriptional regulator [Rhodoblastus sp.]
MRARRAVGNAENGTPARRKSPVGGDIRSSPKALDLDNYAVAYLTWIANKISSSASVIYRKRFGVGVTDWRIMALLAVEPWIPAGRISEVIGFDRAVISRSVAFMQERGLVETRFQDNNFRRQFIALTKAGLELHDQIVDVAREREEFLLAGLSEQERRAAIRLLAKIHVRASQLAGVGDA